LCWVVTENFEKQPIYYHVRAKVVIGL
jgi:hypothetical protein